MGGFRITALAAALAATDAAQATQVRDQAYTWLSPVASDATGNDYIGNALLSTAPVNGTAYQFLADRDNTGAMTLSVNGGASLPVLIHGVATPAGLVLAGAVLEVVYYNLTYRLVSVTTGGGTINSVESDDPQMISVDNDLGTGIATLELHDNVANGIVKLDTSNKVPVILLPFTDLTYVGIWNASGGTNPSATGRNSGDFFIITVPGNLTIFRDSGANTYTAQVTAVVEGDAIIYLEGSGNVAYPDGWYFDPGAAALAVASTTVMNPTPTLPAVTDVQSWMDQMDPIIASKLPLAGGTMSGPILQPSAPGSPTALANKQYVDDSVAAAGGVSSFNTRTGAVTLTSADVTTALAYTPANKAGDTFTGNVNVTGTVISTGGMAALFFSPEYFINDTFPASGVLDFFNGQSQRIALTANTTITSIDNVPQGSVFRIIFTGVVSFTISWPGTVVWPGGVTPDLSTGPIGAAIVVIEPLSTGGALLATATVY
jgi:hypothetical protein